MFVTRATLVRVSVLADADLTKFSGTVLVWEMSSSKLFISNGSVLTMIGGGTVEGAGGTAASVSFNPAPTAGNDFPFTATDVQGLGEQISLALEEAVSQAVEQAREGMATAP